MTKPAIAVVSGPWDPAPWAEAARIAGGDRPVFIWPEIADAGAVGYALAWRPPTGALRSFPNLRVIFSLGAGVEHVVFQPDLPDVPIVRVVERDLTQRMTEWVVHQVLMHHRRQRAYDALQRRRHWHELSQRAARDVRVGVMGMGVLGQAAANALARLGFDVAGWSRSGKSVAGIPVFSARDLDAFLARTDILVSLLPLTRETRGILAMPLFEKLTPGGAGLPVLINAGRGGLQVEADIVKAIERGVLAGASLDVFEREPLDPASALWGLENVIITPHAAAWSSPAELVPPMLRQMDAFEAGKPLVNVVDRARGY
jgi:glyoxylate/hydroxypyruvate reductase A